MKQTIKEFLIYGIAVIAIVTLAFLPVLSAQFVNWDDQSHLLDNHELEALQFGNIREIFSSTVQKTYIPLSMLSFAVENRLFGHNPFVFHLDNLLLHVANTLLIFVLAGRLGLTARAGAFAAVLFGVHPMHVESVAWVTERKDVLYAFFYLLGMHQYWSYLQTRRIRPYMLAWALGLLSLLAKPMALSFPLALGLLDWFHGRRGWRAAILDKVPVVMYVVPVTWITYQLHMRNPVHGVGEAVLTWIWTFSFYPMKFFWPVPLIPIYHLPEPVTLTNGPFWMAVLFFMIAAVCVWRFRRNRWAMFAAGYFFLSIFFLLRFDHGVDTNFVADRFMYLPSLGFCMLLGYITDGYLAKLANRKALQTAVTAGIWSLMLALSLLTVKQCQVWYDTISLWSYVIPFWPKEYLAYNNRAVGYVMKGAYDLAIQDYRTILSFDPNSAETFFNRGQTYHRAKQYRLAVEDFNRVIEQHPDFDKVYNNRGMVYYDAGRGDLALRDFDMAIQLNPSYAEAYDNRANVFNQTDRFEEALADYNKAIALNPRYARSYNNRGIIYGKQKQYEQAIRDFDMAIALNPQFAEPYYNRSVMKFEQQQYQPAYADAVRARELGAGVPDDYLRQLQELAAPAR